MNAFRQVEYFNKAVIGIERECPQTLGIDKRWLIGAILEELEELLEADNTVDEADALADIIYFAMGGFTRMGISSKKASRIFNAVHCANMAKVAGKKESRAVEGVTDAAKPVTWVGPEETIKQIIDGDDYDY